MQSLDLLARQHLAQVERHLETAHHCIIRQLHTLSRLGLYGADLSLGETVLETMLSTQELIVKDKERLERVLGLKPAEQHKPRPLEASQEPTSLLRQRKLGSADV